VIACATCGRPPDDPDAVVDGVPFGWMLERDGPRTSVVCPPCQRQHSRAIEGKLEQAWW